MTFCDIHNKRCMHSLDWIWCGRDIASTIMYDWWGSKTFALAPWKPHRKRTQMWYMLWVFVLNQKLQSQLFKHYSRDPHVQALRHLLHSLPPSSWKWYAQPKKAHEDMVKCALYPNPFCNLWLQQPQWHKQYECNLEYDGFAQLY